MIIPSEHIVVRTVTVFIPSSTTKSEKSFKEAVQIASNQARNVREILKANSITVQTIRISCSSPNDFGTPEAALRAALILDESGMDYANIGAIFPADDDNFLSSKFIVDMIKKTKHVSMSVSLIDQRNNMISQRSVRESSSAVHEISKLDPEGFSNFRFAAFANVKPFGPFFPASYCSDEKVSTWSGKPYQDTGLEYRTALGIQGASVLQYILKMSTIKLGDGSSYVQEEFYEQLKNGIQYLSQKLNEVCKPVTYVRLDFSTAPLPDMDNSVGDVFIKCAGVERFEGPGILAVAARIAAAIDTANFERTGFCGIMLPVSEDIILARDATNISDLLIYSSVCGTGLDTVPVPGDLSKNVIEKIMIDVSSMSLRLANKQLTVRLMPIPGRKSGELSSFESPYMSNGPVLKFSEKSEYNISKQTRNDIYLPSFLK